MQFPKMGEDPTPFSAQIFKRILCSSRSICSGVSHTNDMTACWKKPKIFQSRRIFPNDRFPVYQSLNARFVRHPERRERPSLSQSREFKTLFRICPDDLRGKDFGDKVVEPPMPIGFASDRINKRIRIFT